MVAPLRAFERALSQRPISLLLARKTLDNNNKIRESSALPEPSQNAQRAGATMLELFNAPAPVCAVETMVWRLSIPKTASLDGVMDEKNARCISSNRASKASSPTRLELPRRTLWPPDVVCEHIPPLPTGPQ
jgi:hypothetical protein